MPHWGIRYFCGTATGNRTDERSLKTGIFADFATKTAVYKAKTVLFYGITVIQMCDFGGKLGATAQ